MGHRDSTPGDWLAPLGKSSGRCPVCNLPTSRHTTSLAPAAKEQAPFQQDAQPCTEYSHSVPSFLPDTQKRRPLASVSPTEFIEFQNPLPCRPVARVCAYFEFRAVECRPQIIMQHGSDTMATCGVTLTTIKKRDKTVKTTTRLSACSTHRGTTFCF